jgi:type I restriction enzyme S subunit
MNPTATTKSHASHNSHAAARRGGAAEQHGAAMKKGWQTKTLGEICDIERGGSPRPIQEFITTDPNGINWIKIGDATASGKYIYKTEEKIKPEGVKRSRMVYEGDFILSNSMSFGRPYIMKTTGCIHDGWLVLHQPKVDPDYLYHALSSDLVFDQFDRLAAGSTVRNLNIGLAKSVEIPYPPLSEQQRIVGLLDAAFAGLATAKANAEKNLQNTRALFESHLQSVFTQRGKGWKATKLGEEIDLLAGFAFKSAQYTNKDKDVRLLRDDNIIQGCLRWDDVKRWPGNDTKDYERYELCDGDVVLAMDRPWIKAGLKHATIAADDLPCLLVQRTARLRGGVNLDNRFLKLLIGSSAFTSHILGVQTGIGVPHISGQQIKDFEFARPPVADQRRIADNLKSLREETQRLASLYERKLAALEALKKSLLHQAFSGEL